jgi:hypothetical protein
MLPSKLLLASFLLTRGHPVATPALGLVTL